MGLYLFLVTYAVSLFLLAVVLVPQSWDGVDDLGEYFLDRRAWFYALLLGATGLDIVDTLLKGGLPYLTDELTPWTWSLWALTVVVAVAGLRSRAPRLHVMGAVSLLSLQLIQGFSDISSLGL